MSVQQFDLWMHMLLHMQSLVHIFKHNYIVQSWKTFSKFLRSMFVRMPLKTMFAWSNLFSESYVYGLKDSDNKGVEGCLFHSKITCPCNYEWVIFPLFCQMFDIFWWENKLQRYVKSFLNPYQIFFSDNLNHRKCRKLLKSS